LNPIIIQAVVVVTFALICYSIGVINEQRKSAISPIVLFFLTAGVLLDISSTALMLVGSTNIPLTIHGCIGYTALIVMLIDAFLIWKHWLQNGRTTISRRLHLYTRIAYSWWVIAYIFGAVMSTILSS